SRESRPRARTIQQSGSRILRVRLPERSPLCAATSAQDTKQNRKPSAGQWRRAADRKSSRHDCTRNPCAWVNACPARYLSADDDVDASPPTRARFFGLCFARGMQVRTEMSGLSSRLDARNTDDTRRLSQTCATNTE